MSTIRPFAEGDVAAAAALFQETFLDPRAAAPAGLAAYMRRLYLGEDGDIPSLVHVDKTGAVTGFIGVDTLAMRHGDRPLRAAIGGSLMVRDHDSDPMAGARLLKAFLAGPQDISLSETASEVAARMWTGLRGVVLAQYSLDWVRVFRPGSFAVHAAAQRLPLLRLLVPFGYGVDRLAALAMKGDGLYWPGMRATRPVPGGLVVREIDAAAFAALVEPLTAQFSLRPQWAPGQLDAILADARQKPAYGELVLCAVETRAGAPVGAFAYHVRPGRIARVLQVLARPGQAGPVLDGLIGDAFRRGAAALRGRTQPALLDGLLGRRVALINVGSTVVHSRDPALVEACRAGELFFNGLAGEHWNRMIGGTFD
ncbi:MAG TPA: hypothetical protein PL183_03620 [Aquamicrobium sp.]|nr:hypothetical protein [Aquamicrobium sp.]